MENHNNHPHGDSKRHPLSLFAHCPVCGSHRFVADTEKSNRCDSCGFEWFLNPSSAVAAFIERADGCLLVARRGCEPARGTLDLPGGFCDIGESAEEAVAREVAEETGLQVTQADYLFSVPNTYLYSGFHIPTLDMFFRCSVATDHDVRAMDDVAESLWMPRADLHPEDFGLQSIRQAVERYLLLRG